MAGQLGCWSVRVWVDCWLWWVIDQRDALVGVGPVAELELGDVSAGEGYGVVVEDLDALLAGAGHLQVHARGGGRADGLQVEVAAFGGQAELRVVPGWSATPAIWKE